MFHRCERRNVEILKLMVSNVQNGHKIFLVYILVYVDTFTQSRLWQDSEKTTFWATNTCRTQCICSCTIRDSNTTRTIRETKVNCVASFWVNTCVIIASKRNSKAQSDLRSQIFQWVLTTVCLQCMRRFSGKRDDITCSLQWPYVRVHCLNIGLLDCIQTPLWPYYECMVNNALPNIRLYIQYHDSLKFGYIIFKDIDSGAVCSGMGSPSGRYGNPIWTTLYMHITCARGHGLLHA